jgi:hypothetical protein
MSAETMGVVVLFSDSIAAASTGSHIGPVLWQGIMLGLFGPIMGTALWAFMKQPLYPYSEEEKRLFRKYRFIYRLAVLLYILIGVILFFVIRKMGL